MTIFSSNSSCNLSFISKVQNNGWSIDLILLIVCPLLPQAVEGHVPPSSYGSAAPELKAFIARTGHADVLFCSCDLGLDK